MRTDAEFTEIVKAATWKAFDELCREDKMHTDATDRDRLRLALENGVGRLVGIDPRLRDMPEERLFETVRRIVREGLAERRPS